MADKLINPELIFSFIPVYFFFYLCGFLVKV
ncbi:putative membrane protein, partial [Yersinia pestis PY-14]